MALINCDFRFAIVFIMWSLIFFLGDGEFAGIMAWT